MAQWGDYMSMDYNFIIMLKDDFTIKRKVKTPDGAGGFSSTLSTIDTVKGRLDEETSVENLFAVKDVDFIRERLFLYPGSNVFRDDQIEGIGRVFRVRYLATVHENHPLEVICEEIYL